MLHYLIRLSVVGIVFNAGFVIAATDPQDPPFAIKEIVVDPMGAVISQAEVVFKGESGTIVTHTGMDGAANVNLVAGKCLVTVSACGFATTKLTDVSVPGSTADAFRVSLNVDQSRVCHGWWGPSPNIDVPTVPSELPDIIQDEPTRNSLPVAQAATTKRRSTRCLYLWRCSAPQP